LNKNYTLSEIIEKLFKMLREYEHKAIIESQIFNLSIKQLSYINTIYNLKNVTITQLSKLFKVTKPTISNTVSRLIKDGYLMKKQSDKDKRYYSILVTEIGSKIIRNYEKSHTLFAETLLKVLSKNELKELSIIFNKMMKNLVV